MSTKQATHFTPILCESGDSAPEYIQILPAGSFAPNDGRGPWVLSDCGAVIAATRRALGNLDMLLDYNHQSEHSAKNGRPAPAAGWITDLEARADGIYGKVAWTERGAEAVKKREFRYISPVFLHDRDGRVTRLVSCALTNTPALDLAALCERNSETSTREQPDMDPKLIAQAFGLAETATEAEIIAACAAARKAQCEAQKGPDPAKYVPIDAHNAVMAELAALKKEQCEARAAALVSEAKSKGKLAPAMETWAKSYAGSNPDGFRTWLEAAPAVSLDKELLEGKPPQADGKKLELTDEQKQICQVMGLDEAKYLEEAAKWQN